MANYEQFMNNAEKACISFLSWYNDIEDKETGAENENYELNDRAKITNRSTRGRKMKAHKNLTVFCFGLTYEFNSYDEAIGYFRKFADRCKEEGREADRAKCEYIIFEFEEYKRIFKK